VYSALLAALKTQDVQNDVDTPLQRPRGNPDVLERRPLPPSSPAPNDCGPVDGDQLGAGGPRGLREGEEWKDLVHWDPMPSLGVKPFLGFRASRRYRRSIF
jgi:hypothetical protein